MDNNITKEIKNNKPYIKDNDSYWVIEVLRCITYLTLRANLDLIFKNLKSFLKKKVT